MYERGEQGNINWWVVVFLGTLYFAFFLTVCNFQITANSFMVAGYAKASITFVKYMPQVYLNYQRKSTIGWSLANVCLDLTGGIFSLLQMGITSTPESFNIIKLTLGVLSIGFDCIFLW